MGSACEVVWSQMNGLTRYADDPFHKSTMYFPLDEILFIWSNSVSYSKRLEFSI